MTGNALVPLEHAELGASNAHRWIPCPGSVRLSRGRPNTENEHSRLGTAAHALGSLALEKNVDPDMWLGLQINDLPVDDDMVEAVRVYTDYCQAIMALPGVSFWIERNFSLAELNPPGRMFGTADFSAYWPEEFALEVVDYKHGSGVVVEVWNNAQFMYYALGVILALGLGYRIDTIKITVIQPRAGHKDGIVRSQVFDYLDILAFAGDLMEAARRTTAPDAPLVPGSHCRFCPASAVCPAQFEMAQSLARIEFAAVEPAVPPAPSTLPVEILSDIGSKLPILEAWTKAVYAEIQGRLEHGEVVPGWKLVDRKPVRKWIDEAQTVDWLQSQGYATEEIHKLTVKSPAQIEALINGGKKTRRKDRATVPEGFVEKVSSGYTLAPETDDRAEITLIPGQEFEALPASTPDESQNEATARSSNV